MIRYHLGGVLPIYRYWQISVSGLFQPPFQPFFYPIRPIWLELIFFAWWLLSCWLKTWWKMPILTILTFLWKECDWGDSNFHSWSRKSDETVPKCSEICHIPMYWYVLPINQYANHEIIGNINMSWLQAISIPIWAFRLLIPTLSNLECFSSCGPRVCTGASGR